MKLGDLFDIGSSKRVLKSQWQSEGVPFYRGREITILSNGVKVDNELFISDELYNEFKDKNGVPQVGDIMITAIGTIGNTYIVQKEDKFYFKDASVLWLKPKREVSSRYITYWLKTDGFFSQLDKGNGATVDTLSIKKLSSVTLNLPPLSEQYYIAEKLDKAFSDFDKVISSSIKKSLEIKSLSYKQIASVLNELFGEYKSEELCKVTMIQPKKRLALDKLSEEENVSFMGMEALGIEQKYSSAKINRPLKDVYKAYQYFEEGDVVFAKISPCFENGKLGIMSDLTNKVGFGSSEFVVLRPSDKISSDFLYYCILDENFRKQGIKNMSGAVGHKRVIKEFFYRFKIPIPPADIQSKATAKLDLLWKNTSDYLAIQQNILQELKSLKSAMLTQELQGKV